MRKINIRKFQQNLHKEILDLPLEVTKYGKIIFTVNPPATQQEKSKNVLRIDALEEESKDMGKRISKLEELMERQNTSW